MSEERLKISSNYVFIQYLRVIAMVLVLWDHLVPGAYYGMGVQPPASIVERYILWPLAITNYFGAFAVDVFFIISGFLAVATLKKTGVISFLLKRLVRITPPLLFGGLVFMMTNYLLGNSDLFDVQAYLSANGALWYVKVLVVYYILFACCIPVLRKTIFGGILLCQGLAILLCELSKQTVLPMNIGASSSYIFYIAIGMAFYMVFTKKEHTFFTFLVQFIISWYGIIHYNIATFNPERADTGSSFGVSAMYAILFFTVFLLADHLLPSVKAVGKVAEYSYGMYLYHMPWFALVLPFLSHPDSSRIRLWCYTAVAITLVLSIGTTCVQNRWVDPPCRKILKKILGRLNDGQL